jgi:hypothetical protein
MFIPYAVDVPMKRLPWANWALIALTMAVSIADTLRGKPAAGSGNQETAAALRRGVLGGKRTNVGGAEAAHARIDLAHVHALLIAKTNAKGYHKTWVPQVGARHE